MQIRSRSVLRLAPAKTTMPKLILAPMQGLTDAPMRDLLTRIGGYDECVSEFVRIPNDLKDVTPEERETIDKMLENNGNIDSISQGDFSQFSEDELKTAPKIFKETCQIDWTLPAKRVYDFVRGLSPYPGTWTHLEENGRQSVLKIFKTAKTSATGSGETGSIKIEKTIKSKPIKLILSNFGFLIIASIRQNK